MKCIVKGCDNDSKGDFSEGEDYNPLCEVCEKMLTDGLIPMPQEGHTFIHAFARRHLDMATEMKKMVTSFETLMSGKTIPFKGSNWKICKIE